jgi:release factor glutamine methyltransferase
MTLESWLRKAETRLSAGPHPERARRDAETLLLHLIQRDRAFLIAHPEEALSAEGVVRYYALVERRAAGEPIQYITGEQEFYGLPFHVNHNVLIPRPETEGLVERVLELAAGFARPRIVDVGTGSGAIAVALAANLPQATVTAIDISEAALEVARINAERNGVADRIRFTQCDLLAPFAAGSFEFVVSNPPYVPSADRDSLAAEVRDHEPHMALFAGEDGLAIYRRLIPAAHAVLAAGGWLALEIGCGQAEAMRGLLAEAGFVQIEFARDLQGIERVATARRP